MSAFRWNVAIALIGLAAVTGARPIARPVAGQTRYAHGRVDYDIVYVRQPRFGDVQETIWPEVFHPG